MIKGEEDSDFLPSECEDVGIDSNDEIMPVKSEPSPTDQLLPLKSKELYEKRYEDFKNWCAQSHLTSVSEDVLLAYFNNLVELGRSSSSLWSMYSMLKSMLILKEQVNIKHYPQLLVFLKQRSEKYVPKRAKTLTKVEIDKFLKDANDYDHLLTKTALIIGVRGACRCDELLNLTTSDLVSDQNNDLIISIPNSKTHFPRLFAINNPKDQSSDVNYVEIVNKYIRLRPSHTKHNRFFVSYNKGKCSTLPVGKNTLGKIATNVARYLNLPNPELYTGHSLRRSSANMSSFVGSRRYYGWTRSIAAQSPAQDQQELVGNNPNASFRPVLPTSTSSTDQGENDSTPIITQNGTLPPYEQKRLEFRFESKILKDPVASLMAAADPKSAVTRSTLTNPDPLPIDVSQFLSVELKPTTNSRNQSVTEEEFLRKRCIELQGINTHLEEKNANLEEKVRSLLELIAEKESLIHNLRTKLNHILRDPLI